MKYMLMMNTPGNGPYQIGSWPKQDIQAHIGFMIALNKKLRDSGEFVGAEGLSGPDQARLVRAGKDGAPVTDGVFPESKEFLAGYWIVDVDSPARAYADRRRGLGGARTRRRAAQHGDRGPRGDERPAARPAVSQPASTATPSICCATSRRRCWARWCAATATSRRARTRCRRRCIAAAQQWPRDGRPDNPRGWLIQVASRRMVDQVRSDSARRQREHAAALDLGQVVAAASVESRARRGRDADAALHVLPPVAHDVVGRRADAARGGRPDDGADRQRVSRARSHDGAADQPRQADDSRLGRAASTLPAARARGERLDTVLHVLYLIFNEGYTASVGAEPAAVDLSAEAIRLARAVQRLTPDDTEAAGLLALMILTDARRNARDRTRRRADSAAAAGPLALGSSRDRRRRGAAHGHARSRPRRPVSAAGRGGGRARRGRALRGHRLAADRRALRRCSSACSDNPMVDAEPGHRRRHGAGTRGGPRAPRHDRRRRTAGRQPPARCGARAPARTGRRSRRRRPPLPGGGEPDDEHRRTQLPAHAGSDAPRARRR